MASPSSTAPAPTLACDKPGTLITATRRLLERDERPRVQLAADLGVPLHWLNTFIQGGIDAPSVNRIQYIYEKLSGHKMVY